MNTIAPGIAVPPTDPNALRRLLLKAIDPEVQKFFHRLEAARTPDEWVALEDGLLAGIGALVVEHDAPDSRPFPFKASTMLSCPACRTAVPRFTIGHADGGARAINLHLVGGEGLAPCGVISELVVYFNESVRPRLFSDDAIDAARTRLKALKDAATQARNNARSSTKRRSAK